MKELHFSYQMRLTFQPQIEKHRFTLKCIPHTTECQRISELELKVFPKESMSKSKDSFGNICVYGYVQAPHQEFSVEVTGVAATGLQEYESALPEHRVASLKYQTAHTQPGPAILAFAERCPVTPGMSNLTIAQLGMEQLGQQFYYCAGSTVITTSAEQAMEQGQGVCQDYAHILLSFCRIHHIPCHYVAGMFVGEGASHAWVEIYDQGRWIGLDPTNHRMVDEEYIRISVGRDYKDCAINQGVFIGQTTQTQEISVRVWEEA